MCDGIEVDTGVYGWGMVGRTENNLITIFSDKYL